MRAVHVGDVDVLTMMVGMISIREPTEMARIVRTVKVTGIASSARWKP